MNIDYKKELETTAKSMILVHEPDTLIRMILRTIVQKVQVSHAGILLRQQDKDGKDTYILKVSRGSLGLKIPAGFVRLDMDNPLIRFFKERQSKNFFATDGIVYEQVKSLLEKDTTGYAQKSLEGVLYQMEILQALVCVPSYFRQELLGILLLGRKNNEATFTQEELGFFTALSSNVAMAVRNAQLFQELELELDKKRRLFIHTTVALAAAIDAKDHYTHGHTARVTSLSLGIARKLMEKDSERFDEEFLENLHIASLLHDIGKIGVPEAILNKEGMLTEEEKMKMREHPLIGVEILQPIQELAEAMVGVKYHHERFDGAGYPEGLKGEQIPLIAAIISVADAFDAMTTHRPYSHAFSKPEAVQEVQRLSGQQFAPWAVEALLELFAENKL